MLLFTSFTGSLFIADAAGVASDGARKENPVFARLASVRRIEQVIAALHSSERYCWLLSGAVNGNSRGRREKHTNSRGSIVRKKDLDKSERRFELVCRVTFRPLLMPARPIKATGNTSFERLAFLENSRHSLIFDEWQHCGGVECHLVQLDFNNFFVSVTLPPER